MLHTFKESLWKQFGASIDMLQNALTLWQEETWNNDKKFFYMAYHSLIMLDYYLTNPPKDFSTPLPFSFAEPDQVPDGVIGDIVPNHTYTKQELLDYLQASRKKCRQLIEDLTEEKLQERWVEDEDASESMDYPVLEILLYNMRHLQHHAAQLNMLLRQKINQSPGWIAQTEDGL